MVIPIIPLLIGASFATSAGANLYSQHNQRRVARASEAYYRRQEQAYRSMENGYNRYLARQGRRANPDRSWLSYYGAAQHNRLMSYSEAQSLNNSYAASVGTTAGSFGAALGLGARSISPYRSRPLKSDVASLYG